MIVPHGDPLYYKERPRVAVPARNVVDLDGYFGLHPRLAALTPLWDNKSLAVIHAVGSPDSTRSHFDAQDYMESGIPGRKGDDGWLNRYCQQNREHANVPYRAVAFGARVPRILAGPAPSVSLAYPRGGLGGALQQVAHLIKANVGLQVAFVESTGWDTHVNQGASDGELATRLADLAQALAAFTKDVGPGMRDVVVVTMSEFGRAIGENGAQGTDHGHGTAVLVLGGPVNGGKVLGRWPGLDPANRFEGRDVAVTTDYRDLCGEILARHMRATDLASIFPGLPPDPSRFPGAIAV